MTRAVRDTACPVGPDRRAGRLPPCPSGCPDGPTGGRRPASAAGFTLLELVLVLAILGAVSLLATQSLRQHRNHLLAERADRELADLAAAIAGDPSADPDTAAPSFVADLGRLPRAQAWTNRDGTVGVALGELAVRPEGVPAYRRVAVTPATVCTASGGAPCNPAADASAFVFAGWRGPYGRAETREPWHRDPWGTPLWAVPGGASTNRIGADLDFECPAPGEAVGAIRHLGADAEPDGTSWARGDPDDADSVADLRPAMAATALCRASFSNATAVVFRLYLPCDCDTPRDTPAVHVREATDALDNPEPGQANDFAAAFVPVPRGRWLYTAHPVGDDARVVRKWVTAR